MYAGPDVQAMTQSITGQDWRLPLQIAEGKAAALNRECGVLLSTVEWVCG